MSHLGVQARPTEQTNCRVRVSKLGTLSEVQLGTNYWLPPCSSDKSPDLTLARQSCPSHLSHNLRPLGLSQSKLCFFSGSAVLCTSVAKQTQTRLLSVDWLAELKLKWQSWFDLHHCTHKVRLDMFEYICRNESLLCGGAAELWVITVLTVIVLVGCWLTWLLVFVQRGKEELREATALLTAQQTSLEIIVNMCCSDGECCGHGHQCWPRALCIKIISCDIATRIGKAIVAKKTSECPVMPFVVVCRWRLLIHSMHFCSVKTHPTTSGRRSRAVMRATWVPMAFVMECPTLCPLCACQLKFMEP